MDKEFIISEIQRTAQVGGGKPLGRERFEKETGIKQSDWYGKYWARWSDALIEAGFKQNTLNMAYPEKFVICKIIELIRELGNFPTFGQIRLKGYKNKDFPAHNTFLVPRCFKWVIPS